MLHVSSNAKQYQNAYTLRDNRATMFDIADMLFQAASQSTDLEGRISLFCNTQPGITNRPR